MQRRLLPARSTSASKPCRSCRWTRSSSIHQPIAGRATRLRGRDGDHLRRRAVRRRHRHHPQRSWPSTQTASSCLEAFTTLMGHEGDNSISLKWDPETGQVVRTADAPAKADPEPADAEQSRISNSDLAPMYTRTSGFSQVSALSVGFGSTERGARELCESRAQVCHAFIQKGRSSTGRAAVSKTAGCRFKSCRPCSTEYSTQCGHWKVTDDTTRRKSMR